MASICISCTGIGFARPSHEISFPSIGFARRPSHGRGRRNVEGVQKQLLVYSTNSTTMAVTTDTSVVRRSANYPPSLWSYDFLQSLSNNYLGEKYKTELLGLIELVKTMISECNVSDDPLSTLELVDDLQRLGISYHFKDEISNVLKMVYMCYFEAHVNWNKLDLNLKALGFRLLRQHGYHIPQEIFEDIKDETGNIKDEVRNDIVGVLNLYEASFFAVVDENILDEVRELTIQCLEKKLEDDINNGNPSMSMLISHALELPLLWRPQRFEAIWFIEAYRRRNDMIPALLELAVLDFNIVQGIHKEDLIYSSRWWDSLGWHKKFSFFARDRLVESFMWAVGASYQPSLNVLRRNITKLISLINVIDDVYDVYGTVDELKQFTDVVRRWDTNAIEELPEYMKICFLGFYNTINEMAYDTLANEDILVLPYVKKAWADYCDAAFLEAQWFHSGYTPTLDEYLKNSCVSISLPVILANIYYFTSSDLTGEALQNIVHYSSMILRLSDDLGTSTAELERGDVPKSIQCYMHETGASEEKAREYIKKLIMQTWKKLNVERMSAAKYYPSSEIFIECATNLGRMGQFTYHDTDVFGTPDDLYKSHEISLLFNPIS